VLLVSSISLRECEMTYQVGLDGNWYAVFVDTDECWDAWQSGFKGFRIACFGQYENAIQISDFSE
jgi:hypothetical protein